MRSLLAAVAALAVASSATAQQPAKPDASVHKLRNVAAADAVKALNTFADQKKLAVTAVAEPTSNSVVIAGGAEAHKRLVERLEALDKRPEMVVVQLTVVEAAAGFADDVGLLESADNGWVLTAREARLFGVALRHAKERGEVDVLGRPMLELTDNQRGEVEAQGVKVRVTPRLTGGGVMLRADADVTRKGTEYAAVRATALAAADGQTVVLRGERRVTEGVAKEVYLVLTVHRVRSE